MKKKLSVLLIFIIISSIFLGGCAINVKDTTSNTLDNIVAPKDFDLTIEGTWKINDYIIIGNNNETNITELNSLIGKEAAFSRNVAYIGDEACINPQYKVRTLETNKYLYYATKRNNVDLGISDNIKFLDVVSVSSEDNHFYDVIKVKDNEIRIKMKNALYSLSKVSDKVDESKKPQVKAMEQSQDIKRDFHNSGVLLGLKVPDEESNTKFTYKTLWISYVQGKFRGILEMPGILLPRINSFERINLVRIEDEHISYDKIYSETIDLNNKNIVKSKNENLEQNKKLMEIGFIGDDYVSVNYSTDLLNPTKSLDKVGILAIDNLGDGKSINISDIYGKDGKNQFNSTAKEVLASLEDNIDNVNYDENNIVMQRHNGHWILKGRVFYTNNLKENKYSDFPINVALENKLVNYDNLPISWNEIKEKIPEAKDVVISPNDDFAVIITNDDLYVYDISGKELSSKAVDKIDIGKGSSIIMSEWATGEYVDKWEDIFKSIIKH